jgi:hypothetical protein
MPLDPTTAPFPWKLIASKRAKANKRESRKAVGLLEVNGLAAGHLAEVVVVDAPTKARVKERQKENPKERKAIRIRKEEPKERKEEEEAK